MSYKKKLINQTQKIALTIQQLEEQMQPLLPFVDAGTHPEAFELFKKICDIRDLTYALMTKILENEGIINGAKRK